MKILRNYGVVALLLAALSSAAFAGSTINPTVPAANSALTSAPVRSNFAAAYNDINNILGMFAGPSAPGSPTVGQNWLDTTTSPAVWKKRYNTGWGTIGTFNISSGAFVVSIPTPTAAANTFYAGPVSGGAAAVTFRTITGADLATAVSIRGLGITASTGTLTIANGKIATFSNTITIAGTDGSTINVGAGGTLGTAAFQNTGTSGATIPFLNGANVWSAVNKFNLNAANLPTALTGSVLQIGNADGVTSRIEVDAFGAQAFITAAAYGGTAASPTALTSGTQIGGFNFYGYNGTAIAGPLASFRAYAAENLAVSSSGSRLCLASTALTTTTLADSLCQQPSGGVTLGSGPTDQGAGTLNLLGALYNNGTAPTGTGGYVRATSPSIAGPTITGSFTATGLVGLPNLASQIANTVVANFTSSGASPVAFTMPSCTGSANALQYVNGTGITCSAIVAAAGSVAIGTTTITAGTTTRILYDNAGVLGEYTISGSGTAVAMNTGPAISGGSHVAITSLGIRSTGAAFDLTIASTEVFTAGRTLTVTLNDAARTLNLGGNFTTAGAFTQAGAFATTITSTATSNATLPAGTNTLASLNLAGQTVSGGANVTPANLGTTSSGTLTLNCGTVSLQYGTLNGAFTLAAPANDGSCIVRFTNGASAGTITFSGWTVGANTGDTYATTNAKVYDLFVRRINGVSSYSWSLIN